MAEIKGKGRALSILGIVAVIGLVLLFGGAKTASAGEENITICHIPPGNPANAHTITVGQPALNAHLNHGDTIGPCEGE